MSKIGEKCLLHMFKPQQSTLHFKPYKQIKDDYSP